GAAAYAYTQGYGWPTQESVIEEFFANPKGSMDTLFVETNDRIVDLVNQVVTDPNVAIDGMNTSMSETVAYVTAHTSQGGEVAYKVILVRDLIGWKISHVEIYFPALN
ncbi:MAG: hypothetical protein FWE65_00505, partial [Eggerthellaceae bacterium]|nr:hypothetical protein [Eggerthellaceae bacterium]